MQRCEVLVIGGGPAGSSCARFLASEGVSVLVMDRERFPRDKPCAGWITPEVLALLGIDPVAYGSGRLLQPIREFRTGLLYRDEVVTDFAHTVSYGILRSEFDHYLLSAAGCPTLLGEAATKMVRKENGWLVNDRIEAAIIVGAGGHHCPVARAMGAVPNRESAILAMVAEFRLPERELSVSYLPAGCVELHFTPDLSGYGWLFRKGCYLNVGFGVYPGSGVRLQSQDFCAHLQLRGDIPLDLAPHLKGHAYLPYRRVGGREVVADRAMLVGDAAGVSSPQSGEGILPAVESGRMAARTILEAAGDYRRERLEPYRTSLRKRFGAHRADAPSAPATLRKLAGAAILSNGWLTRHLVLDRWFLHADET
ncbi:NAD(P)/FAD-dependent oxidoreductase [Geomonas sp. Red276]